MPCSICSIWYVLPVLPVTCGDTEVCWALAAHQAHQTRGLRRGLWNLVGHSAFLCLSFPSVKAGSKEDKTRDYISILVGGETEARRDVDFAPGHVTAGGLSTEPILTAPHSLPCSALCVVNCAIPGFYGDPVGGSRHHLDWDSPMTRSIPLKEGRERDPEPVIPKGGPGGALAASPQLGELGCCPSGPSSSGSSSWSPGAPSASAPFCLHPSLPERTSSTLDLSLQPHPHSPLPRSYRTELQAGPSTRPGPGSESTGWAEVNWAVKEM